MPDAVSTQPQAQARGRVPRFTLNSDGQRHPVLNAITAVTFFAGIAAFVLGLIVRFHVAATTIGIATFALGLFAQMMSATREERIFIVTGIVAAFVGMGLGIGHGGF
jgi:hypothetical protein